LKRGMLSGLKKLRTLRLARNQVNIDICRHYASMKGFPLVWRWSSARLMLYIIPPHYRLTL
jgi:hypothetical protein